MFRQSQLGYVWLAQDQTLRPLRGMMGAAFLGDSITAAKAYVAGAASAASGIALLLSADGQVTRMFMADGTQTSAGTLSGGAATARIRFSPSGTAAVVFTPGRDALLLLTGLQGAVQTHALAGTAPVAEAAVSDAGSVVALLPMQGRTAVTVLHPDGSAAAMTTLSGPGALSFAGSGDDLLTVDAGSNVMTLFHTVSTAPNPVAINTANLLKAATAVGAAATGRWAVAVNSAESSVVRVDLTGQTAPQRLVCPGKATVAEPLAYGAFRFSDAGSAPAWVSDITAGSPGMFFVPALPSQNASL